MSYCSPAAKQNEKDGTCFDLTALRNLAKAWNEQNPSDKITGIAKKTKKQLWADLDAHMIKICKKSGLEWCWVDKLGVAKNSLRPATPREWYKKPYAWLSNFDIEAVMKQYEDDKENRYAFLGVHPIDFAATDANKQCMYSNLCVIDVKKYIDRGVKYLGLITNLDRHDESGSHWTSLFICIDPHSTSFGAYYYDSVGRSYPPEIATYIQYLKKTCEDYAASISVRRKFAHSFNKIQHQNGNTECGVFSMVYQIRWLRLLRENPDTKFNNIVEIKVGDEDVHKLRKFLFRPNTKVVIGGGSGGVSGGVSSSGSGRQPTQKARKPAPSKK